MRNYTVFIPTVTLSLPARRGGRGQRGRALSGAEARTVVDGGRPAVRRPSHQECRGDRG